MNPIYFDYAATTPVDQRVAEVVLSHMVSDFGNSGSRTHEYGVIASKAVEKARHQLAHVLACEPSELTFTSGATESNNLAILGLEHFGRTEERLHIVSTAVEHKAVLEPLAVMESRGFEIELVSPGSSGAISADEVLSRVRPDTLLVSVMQVNNETGVIQPITEIADGLNGHQAYLHTDAAQGFARVEGLDHSRIDLVSVSGHKIFGPKGIGALLARRRSSQRVPLKPIIFGGGQERGLRSGTLPVPLIAGFGLAAELAERERLVRQAACMRIRDQLLESLQPLAIHLNGDPELAVPHIINFSIPGLDSEAAILALKPLIAISNGSACTSTKYQTSHVLESMGLPKEILNGSIRISWGHETPIPDLSELRQRIGAFL